MSEQDHIIRPVQGSDIEPLMSLKIITEKWTDEAINRRDLSEANDLTTITYASDSVAHVLSRVSLLVDSLVQGDVATVTEAFNQPLGILRPPKKVTENDLLRELGDVIYGLTRCDETRAEEILTMVNLMLDNPMFLSNTLGSLRINDSAITQMSSPVPTGNRAQRRAKGRRK